MPEKSSKETAKLLSNSEIVVNESSMFVGDVLEKIGVGKFQIIAICILGLSWLAEASELVLSPILAAKLLCLWKLSSVQEAMLTSTTVLVTSISYLLLGLVADNYGRRFTQIVALSSAIVFAVLSATAPNFTWLLIIRLMYSFSTGTTNLLLPYYYELTPLACRSWCQFLLLMFWTIGRTYPSLVAAFVFSYDSEAWQYLALCCCIPLIISTISLVLYIPESPYYLIKQGKPEEACEVLRYIAQKNGKKLIIPKGCTPTLANDESVKCGLLDSFRVILQQKHLGTFLLGFEVILTTVHVGALSMVYLTTEVFQHFGNGHDVCHSGNHHTNFTSKCYQLRKVDYIGIASLTGSEVISNILVGIFIFRTQIYQYGTIGSLIILGLLSILFMCPKPPIYITILIIVNVVASMMNNMLTTDLPRFLPTGIRSTIMGFSLVLPHLIVPLMPFVVQIGGKAHFTAVLGLFLALFGTSFFASVMVNEPPQLL